MANWVQSQPQFFWKVPQEIRDHGYGLVVRFALKL